MTRSPVTMPVHTGAWLAMLAVASVAVATVAWAAPGADSSATAGADSSAVTGAVLVPVTREPMGLGPTTEPPWNPARPAPAAEMWENVVRFPGRLVTYPISGLGWLTRRGLLAAEQNYTVPRTIFLFALLPASGITAGPASLGDRTGLGGTLGLRPPIPHRPLMLEASGSTLHYSAARAAVDIAPLTLEFNDVWRPQDRFYGAGLQSSQSDVSNFGWETRTSRATIHLPWMHADPPSRAAFSAWFAERDLVVRRGHDGESRSAEIAFPAFGMRDRSFSHDVFGARAALDFRGGVPHWSHGWRAAFEAERYDARSKGGVTPAYVGATNPGNPSEFDRYTLEVEAGASCMRDPRTLRVALRAVDNEARGGGSAFPLPDLAHLGGSEGLAGFEPYRFHDLDALVVKLTYLFPLAQHYEFELHAEAGGVYPDMQHDARLDTMKGSYGVALRPRTKTLPMGTIGVEWSAEAVRLRYSLGGVE